MSADHDPEVAAAAAATDGPPHHLPDATGPQASGLGVPEPAVGGPPNRIERLLSFTLALAAFLGLLTTVIWGLTGADNYWPRWVWLGCGGIVAVLASWAHVRSLPKGRRRGLIAHVDFSGVISVYLLLIWLF